MFVFLNVFLVYLCFDCRFVADVFEDIEDVVCLKNICSVEYSLLPIEDWSKAQEKFELEQIRRKSDSQKTEPIPEGIILFYKHFFSFNAIYFSSTYRDS